MFRSAVMQICLSLTRCYGSVHFGLSQERKPTQSRWDTGSLFWCTFWSIAVKRAMTTPKLKKKFKSSSKWAWGVFWLLQRKVNRPAGKQIWQTSCDGMHTELMQQLLRSFSVREHVLVATTVAVTCWVVRCQGDHWFFHVLVRYYHHHHHLRTKLAQFITSNQT